MSEQAMMDPVRESTLDFPFGAVRYLEAGDGPSLVYLHGMGDTGSLLPVFQELASSRRVIRPDHPGFLFSSVGPFDSARELAHWYVSFVDRLGVTSFDLVGCSFGGWLAAELALLIPARVTSLTLIDPAGLGGNGTAPSVFTATSEESVNRTFATERMRSRAGERAPAEETAALLTRGLTAASCLASEPYMHDPSLDHRLSALGIPTQVIWGADDGVIPVVYAESWRRALPHADVTIIPNAGHLPHLEQPEAFRAAAKFLE